MATKEIFYAPVIDDAEYGNQTVNVANQAQDPTSLLSQLRSMLAKRKLYPAFGRGSFHWVEGLDNPALAVFWREVQETRLLIIHNLSDQPQPFDLDGLLDNPKSPYSILSDKEFREAQFTLAPYEFIWLEV